MKTLTKKQTLDLLKDELLIGLIDEENCYLKKSSKKKKTYEFDFKEWYDNSVENSINEFAIIQY